MAPNVRERIGAQRTNPAADAAAAAKVREDKIIQRLGGRARFDVARIPWPGRDDCEIGIRVLSDAEILDAETEAEAELVSKKLRGDRERREDAYCRQAAMLRRALVDPDSGEPLFYTTKALREVATREELDILGIALGDHVSEVAPLPQTLSEEEIGRLIAAVKKTPAMGQELLMRCAPSTLRALFTTWASRMPDPQAGSTSSPTTSDGATSPQS